MIITFHICFQYTICRKIDQVGELIHDIVNSLFNASIGLYVTTLYEEEIKINLLKNVETIKFLKLIPVNILFERSHRIYKFKTSKWFVIVRGSDEQVIRQCGFKEHKSPCYTTVLEEYNTKVKICFKNGSRGCFIALSYKYSQTLTVPHIQCY